MLLCNGRTYSSKYLDIEAKLDLILKELQDLKLKVEVLEYKKESSRDDNRDKRGNTNRNRDGKDDIIRRIKIDPPTFDGILNPKIFSDWMANLNYFD